MNSTVLILVYCALIICSSLAGGALPNFIRLTHTRMQVLVSFVAGLMLGVSILHLLPHALLYARSDGGTVEGVSGWMLVGLLTIFFLIRVFHFHQHGFAEDDLSLAQAGLPPLEGDAQSPKHSHAEAHAHDHDHAHAHEHHHHGHAHEGHSHKAGADDNEDVHPFAWIGVAVGLALHTMIDGVALGAGVLAESMHGAMLPGITIFLVIAAHKPLDALSITSLMKAGGWNPRMQQLVNAGFALMCPLGALVFISGVDPEHMRPVGYALAFSAGVFLCISLSDLLPELQFHSHDGLKLSAALLLGVLAAYTIGFFEHYGHEHLPGAPAPAVQMQDHDHGHAH